MENAKKVLAGAAALSGVVDEVGHVSGLKAKAMALIGLVTVMKEIDGVDFKKAVEEFKAADQAAKADLIKGFAEKFQLADKDLEKKIESGLELALESVGTVSKVIDFVGSFKKPEVAQAAIADKSPTSGISVQ